jgi:hypothetical protein
VIVRGSGRLTIAPQKLLTMNVDLTLVGAKLSTDVLVRSAGKAPSSSGGIVSIVSIGLSGLSPFSHSVDAACIDKNRRLATVTVGHH